MGSLTRRDLLTAILGAPIAAAACRAGGRAPRIPLGEVVGASASFGHAIRDGVGERTPDRVHRAKTVVVGAGIAGLTAAWQLKRSGHDDLVVVELERAPGGTSLSGSNQITAYPWGAHYIPVPLPSNTELIELLGEMNVVEALDRDGRPIVGEQYLCAAPQERVYYRGRWWEGLYLHAGATDDDLRQLDAFVEVIDKWVAFRDEAGRRAFVIPRAHGSDHPDVRELDSMSMSQFMQRHGFDSPRLLWYVDYACRDDYGMKMEETSAWAGVFYFASRVEKSGDEAEPLITWPEGNGRFVRHFVTSIGDRMKTGMAAYSVDQSGDLATTHCLTADGGQIVAIESEHVIFAAPQFMRPFLLGQDQRRLVHGFEYGAWLVANLTLEERPVDHGFPLAWDNVLYESPALGYVCATHQHGLNIGPTVFTWYFALCERDHHAERRRLLELGREEWADIALSDLERAHPGIRQACSRLDLAKWGHAMVLARSGFMWSDALAEAARPVGRIHFAHSDLSGLALFEEAFHHGIRAANEVLATEHA